MSLSIEQLCGQLLVVGFDGTTAPDALRDKLAAGERGGVIVFRRNVAKTATGLVDVEAVGALCRAFTEASPAELPPIVSIDQEGGRVMRLGPPLMQPPAMREIGALPAEEITALAASVGRELRALGFTMSFAPVLDVDTNADNPVIGDRAFGRDVETASRGAIAYARGLRQAGILNCGKHFPGHGDTELDSHLALPRVRHDRARIDAIELRPFREAIAAGVLDSVMTAHVIFDAIDDSVPATVSPEVVTDLLRGELGFEGVCISDDLFMRGVSPSGGDDADEVAAMAVDSVGAGCDMLLFAREGRAVEASHAALVAYARVYERFAARVAEACGRGLAMRRAHLGR